MRVTTAAEENYKAATIKQALAAGSYEHYVTHFRLDECLEVLRFNGVFSMGEEKKVKVGKLDGGALCVQVDGSLCVEFICKEEGGKFAVYELSSPAFNIYEAGYPTGN